MKVKYLKSWILCGAILGVALTVSLCANRWLTRIVCAQLDNSIAQVDSLDIRYGSVKLLIASGHVWINDVYLQTDTLYSQADSSRVMTRVKVEQVSIDGVNYLQWLAQKRVQVNGITVKRPHIESWIEVKDQADVLSGDELRMQMEEEQQKKREEAMRLARVFVEEAVVERITVENAQIQIGAINNHFRTSVDNATMEIYGIGYSFIDSIPYHYNDSVFHFDIRHIDIVLPDGMTNMHSNGITARPGGIVRLDTTHVSSLLSKDGKQFVNGQIDGLRIGGFDALKFNQTKSLDIRSLHIDHPVAEAHVSTLPAQKQKKSARALRIEQEHAEALHRQQQKRMEDIETQVMMFLTEVNIDTIQVHDVCGRFRSSTDYLSAAVDSLSLGIYGLGYSLLDSIPYHYNDSVYEFRMAGAQVVTPDSLVEIVNHGMHYTNGGSLTIGKTRVHHLCDKWELGAIKDNTPQAWIDMTMGELRTSQKNVVREAMTLEHAFVLDTISVVIDKMYVFKDNRYQPKKPFSLPQSAMLSVDYPFHIGKLNAQLKALNLDVAMSREAVGHMELGPLNAVVSNVTAVENDTIHVAAKGNMGTGKLDLAFNLIVNRQQEWTVALNAHDLDLHCLDGFIYPIVGMRIGCNVQRMRANYGGNGQDASGVFCMEYTDLDVQADKNSPSPIRVVANLSGLINSFAKTCLPHQNPITPDKKPRAYKVKWKNDPWKEPALFYIGPIINGAVETMLPGIFAVEKTTIEE